MRFKVKDLMISTIGKEACNPASLQGAYNCTPRCSLDISCQPASDCGCTASHHCGACTQGCSGCTGPTWKGAEALLTEDAHTHIETIERAKSQLKERLAQLDAYQKSVEESLHPATIADVETLETKLNEALKELARRKKELQQKK